MSEINKLEQVIKLFNHNIKTKHLELHPIKPTKKLATTFWDVIKNEKTTDFKYIFFSTDNSNALPKSEQETFDVLLKESKKPNAISYAVYNDNNLIGFFQLRYWENNTTLEISEIWFIKSARGKGFSVETNKTIEEIAFSNPNISRIGWQCFEQNIQSKNAALHNGYKILKTINDSIKKDAVRLVLIKTPPVRQ